VEEHNASAVSGEEVKFIWNSHVEAVSVAEKQKTGHIKSYQFKLFSAFISNHLYNNYIFLYIY
jgi:hypothetical protein